MTMLIGFQFYSLYLLVQICKSSQENIYRTDDKIVEKYRFLINNSYYETLIHNMQN